MSVNIVLIARDRPRLTMQALNSIRRNTPKDAYNLCVVDDGSIEPLNIASANEVTLRISKPTARVGLVKNLGIWFSERYWRRGDYLCVLDNDVYCKLAWLDRLIEACGALDLVGGYRHPYHQPNKVMKFQNRHTQAIEQTDAVAGYCHFMPWGIWDAYGPYDSHAKGVCQSEDFAICQKVIADGGTVGYVHPPVIAVCGITNTEGNPAIGSEAFPREEGLLYL